MSSTLHPESVPAPISKASMVTSYSCWNALAVTVAWCGVVLCGVVWCGGVCEGGGEGGGGEEGRERRGGRRREE